MQRPGRLHSSASFTLLYICIVDSHQRDTLMLTKEPAFFLKIVFDVVSPLGTVGLSLTPEYSRYDFERAVICFLMFPGRLGPRVQRFFLAVPVAPRVRYPFSQIHMGSVWLSEYTPQLHDF